MPRARRLGSAWSRGVVASAAVLLLGGCSSDTVTIDDTGPDEADRAACEALVADLPETLAGEERRTVEPDDALGAAWGDPAYVLTCGVPEPSGYEPTAECNVIAGVGWYAPDDQLGDLGEDVTPVALSLTPYVEVRVPAEHRTDGIDRALSELAPVLREHLGEGLSCL